VEPAIGFTLCGGRLKPVRRSPGNRAFLLGYPIASFLIAPVFQQNRNLLGKSFCLFFGLAGYSWIGIRKVFEDEQSIMGEV